MNPKISVIVPVYKTEKYLHRCVDSILAQTFTEFEVLLIDDGSPDRSGEICDEYAENDSRVRVYHKENGGVGSARNSGIDASMGTWILFLDSDDWFDEMLFDKLTPLVKKEIDIVQFGFSKISNKEIYNRIPQGNGFYGNLDSYNESHSYIPGIAGYVIRRELILNNGIRFSEKIKYSEDHEFIFKCFLCSCKIYVLPLSLYFYRDREGSAVYNLRIEQAYGCVDVISNVESFVITKNIHPTKFLYYWLDYSIKDFYNIIANNKFKFNALVPLYQYARLNTKRYRKSLFVYFSIILYYKIFNIVILLYIRCGFIRKCVLFFKNKFRTLS